MCFLADRFHHLWFLHPGARGWQFGFNVLIEVVDDAAAIRMYARAGRTAPL